MNARKPRRWHAAAIVAIGLGLSLAPIGAAQAGGAKPRSFESELRAALNGHGQAKVVLSACVVDLASGRTLYEQNADQALIPASVMKLIVAAAALDRLGPDFVFETQLAVTHEDLVVIGGGDPALGDEKLCRARGEKTTHVFNKWAATLRRYGVDHVPGRLLIDDGVFDGDFVHPGWPRDQFQEWYAAPVGGLNFADNCIEIDVAPGANGRPPTLTMTPPNTFMRLVNQARTGPKGGLRARRARTASEVVVSGVCAGPRRLGPIAVTDPGQFFAASLRTVLAARGIRVTGPIERRTVRDSGSETVIDMRVIATTRTPLAEVLQRACRDSLGMMAEALIKTLGRAESRPGSWKSGAAAVAEFLRAIGVSQGAFVIDDGSGLSRGNRISARGVTTVLAYAHRQPWGRTLMEALALSGTNGTLKKRMRWPETRGRVYAKTGYINGVRTLAGYVVSPSGRVASFAFLYNGAPATQPLTRAQDQACRVLARGLDAGERAPDAPGKIPSRQ